MKVLHVLEAVGGGTQQHLVDLVQHVTVAEHHVACPPRRSAELSAQDPIAQLRAAGAAVHVIYMDRAPSWHNVAAVARLRALRRTLRPEVVHAHASVAGALARVAMVGGPPLVWTPHALRQDAASRTVERLLRPLADTVIALSPSEAAAIRSSGRARPDQIEIIRNGIDPDAVPEPWPLRATLGIGSERVLVGFLGRLSAQKAPLDFVRATASVIADHPEVEAVCIGSGPLEKAVRQVAAELIPPERFHRLTMDEGASAVLPGLDVFVLPSRYEGGPYTPLEAMRAGVAVVVSDCVGARDAVDDSVTGLVARTGDVESLAAAIARFVDDSALRKRCIRAGRAVLRERFDVRTMAAHYADLYRRLATARAGTACG